MRLKQPTTNNQPATKGEERDKGQRSRGAKLNSMDVEALVQGESQ
jgi:hypothetical protein